MNKELIISQGEKYLNECFKNIRISSLDEIELRITEDSIIFIGEKNVVTRAFNDVEGVEIKENNFIIDNREFEELKEVIDELNLKIKDFNNYAGNRKPISIF